MGKRGTLLVMVLLWVAAFGYSFIAARGIEGPRNLDTGLQRLDELARYQLIAATIAVVTAVLGLFWRKAGRGTLLIGLAPITLTALAIAAFFVAVNVISNGPPPEGQAPGQPAAPATTVPADG